MRPFSRRFRLISFIVGLCMFSPLAARAATTTSLDLSAKRVAFFSDHYVLTADDNVRLRLSDGTVVTGETFSMNLRLNRYLVAGDVHIDGPQIHRTAAALAGYIDVDRNYLLSNDDAPDRLTYFSGDWRDPHAGRQQPGDAFNFPDVGNEDPYILASAARITPLTNIVFDAPRIRLTGADARVPLPRYVVTFSANPHFFENAFSGGRFDIGLPTNGSEHSLTAFHVRNDPTDGTYLSFDQHFVWDHDWLVASINPLTQDQRQLNLIGLKTISPAIQVRELAQESALQYGPPIVEPANAAGFSQTQVNIGLRGSALGITDNQYYGYLLAIPAAPATVDPRWREHPINETVSWTGFERRVLAGTIPLTYRLRSGIGWDHDQFGEGGYAFLNPAPPDLWYHYFGMTLGAPQIKLARDTNLSLTTDKQLTVLPAPHKTDQTITRATLSHHFKKADSYLAYQVTNERDLWGAEQSLAYPTATDVLVTPYGSFPGQEAFAGLGTARQLSANYAYYASHFTTITLTATNNDDFPKPVPGVYGQPPNSLGLVINTRPSKRFGLILGRQYFYNFPSLGWSPQTTIQFTP
jgi:hypothetical protein